MGRGYVRYLGLVGLLVVVAATGVRIGEVRASGHQEVVYVVTGENFPDALSVGSVAALAKAPVLLVTKSVIPTPTRDELNRLQPPKIVVVGGEGVIAPSVVTALEALSFGPTVERLAGLDRFSTAVEVSKSTFPAQMNADLLDGLDSTAFLRRTGKAADAELLDGRDSTAFIGAMERFGVDTSRAAAGRSADCVLGEVWLTAGAVSSALPLDGRLLRIVDNTALFSLFGTLYGGDGRTTFGIPDLRDAAPNGLTYVVCDMGVYPSRR